MGKKLLIDLVSLREMKKIPAEAIMKPDKRISSFKTIRELATFQYTCRQCEQAPCVHICPAGALEKDKNGLISRSVNLCVRCKSCIVACPFGTLMDDLFEVKTSGQRFIMLENDDDLEALAMLFPEDVIRVVDQEENPDENVYRLNDRILIKEKIWQ
jgi:Fe-S-cluster-containing hydrogenase component 2